MKLRIGEFGRLGQVSVQTLRYYDQLGLLKPKEVDPFTSYRYYTLEQLSTLNRILALKDLGISLDQIKSMLAEDLSITDLHRILQVKYTEIELHVKEELDRMERIEARLNLLESQKALPTYEVVLKSVDPVMVVSVRDTVQEYWEVSPLWIRLSHIMKEFALEPNGYYFTLCHATEPEIDLEVCAPLAEGVSPNDGVRQLPAVEMMASTIHRGPFNGLAAGFTALLQWIERNDYVVASPDREIYLQFPKEGMLNSDPDAVTELQIPVRKKGNSIKE